MTLSQYSSLQFATPPFLWHRLRKLICDMMAFTQKGLADDIAVSDHSYIPGVRHRDFDMSFCVKKGITKVATMNCWSENCQINVVHCLEIFACISFAFSWLYWISFASAHTGAYAGRFSIILMPLWYEWKLFQWNAGGYQKARGDCVSRLERENYLVVDEFCDM